MVLCKKCGNRVPSSSLKLDLDEKMVICSNCIKNKNIHKEIKEEIFHKRDEKSQFDDIKSNKVGHKCTSCGYKFMINPETRIPRNCPYCNARVLSF